VSADAPPLPEGRGDSPAGERGRASDLRSSEHPHPLAFASRLPLKGEVFWKASLVAVIVLLATLYIATFPPLLPSHARVVAAWHPSEAWLYDRTGRLIDSERVDFKARRMAWVKLSDVAPVVGETVIAAEDKRFRSHGGVDWLAIGSAVRARFGGAKSRGASTISMQVAAFLSPDLAPPGKRSWRDKLRQMRAGMALESNWSKDEILEAYLNLAGFRGEAQGIGAAAQSLFGKAPSALGRQDAAIIAALLPDPGASVGEVAARACRIFRSPAQAGPQTSNKENWTPAFAGEQCGGLAQSTATALSAERARALDPGLAPHLAVRLLDEAGMRVTTTIDAQVQAVVTTALKRQLQGLGASRARDGAVVVLDNATGEVLAYVGGVGLGSTAAAVDGASAYRQAGSTLKPFLYAQVIEKGWMTPASILDDSPVQLDTASGLYVPQNYDRSFKGPVSVRSALAGSLNVPAVRALLVGGVEAFRDRLWETGYKGLTEDGQYYGFSLALGSAEVTLLEQANAYRSLANGGQFAPVRLRADDPAGEARQILSPQAAWIVSDIMADPSARAGTFGVDSALRLPFWAAAKTGTSKAMRDNWCIGFTDRYTVAVWVGNLEGDSMKTVSGTSGAAPVWRDVMMALHRNAPGKARPRPEGIETRRVSFANNVEPPRNDWFLTGTGQAALAFAPATARRPRITNPLSGSVYALDPDIPIERQLMAVTVTGAVDGHRLVLDRRDLGDARARPQVLAGPGGHQLALLDPGGRVIDRVRFTVR
jgi:penicillin-binding protein 1C